MVTYRAPDSQPRLLENCDAVAVLVCKKPDINFARGGGAFRGFDRDGDAYAAGKAAGDKATFARPAAGPGERRKITQRRKRWKEADTLTICTACAYAVAALDKLPPDWKADGEQQFRDDIEAMLNRLAPSSEFAAAWLAQARDVLNGSDKPRSLSVVK